MWHRDLVITAWLGLSKSSNPAYADKTSLSSYSADVLLVEMYGGGEESIGYGPVGHSMVHHHRGGVGDLAISEPAWSHPSSGDSQQQYVTDEHAPGENVPYPTPPHSFGRNTSVPTVNQLQHTLATQFGQAPAQTDGNVGPIRSVRRQTRLSSRDVVGNVTDVRIFIHGLHVRAISHHNCQR